MKLEGTQFTESTLKVGQTRTPSKTGLVMWWSWMDGCGLGLVGIRNKWKHLNIISGKRKEFKAIHSSYILFKTCLSKLGVHKTYPESFFKYSFLVLFTETMNSGPGWSLRTFAPSKRPHVLLRLAQGPHLGRCGFVTFTLTLCRICWKGVRLRIKISQESPSVIYPLIHYSFNKCLFWNSLC